MTITNHSLFILKLFVVLGSGLVAGVFFAFSSFVMKALARLKPSEGIAAMQSINITVINPWFMTALFGTGVVCLFLVSFSLLKLHQSASIYLLVGSILYIVGTVGVTIVFNVPLNEALAKVEPTSTQGAALWESYLTDWTFWNHVRTIAAFLATGAIALSLV
ncbi:DUF1772 domain-containing protein [Myxosarcina sp. GI1]|uniref:anthrone oxygenase family protein n=1 Tax=Myxosarcina sp. GI1 TaxID=1541065 RepID=UPI00055AA6CD|nr:anthrone oxygenase family protein [Myxosarcina sp. GI1]